jgi:hypothetical protein
MDHSFTSLIKEILKEQFVENSEEVFEKSQLIQYINEKTRSAHKGSKARSSFANLYAIYVITEDYLANGFDIKGDYSTYSGAEFSKLFTRQRQLPFGSKLQNHALNNRMNSEFQKFYPKSEFTPILRDLETNRYWINENLLKIQVGQKQFNIAKAIITIINEYIKTKEDSFKRFIEACEAIAEIENSEADGAIKFIDSLLAPNVDARLFEIVSYSILKYYYHDKKIFWGTEIDKLTEENLKLYKTGRTNANDGGIDFVMKPLGQFFQVTETLDFKKYFLDIEKIQKFPVTFVIKSVESIDEIKNKIEANAKKSYLVEAIIDKYMSCIEEVINIPILQERFHVAVKQNHLKNILAEIILQSKVEFNYSEEEDESE